MNDDQLEFFGRDTLSEERERILRDRGEGTHCKACGQFAKVYKRPIFSTMVICLFQLYHAAARKAGTWVHVNDVARRAPEAMVGGSLAKLGYWGLIEQKPVEEDQKIAGRTTGLWCVTGKGVDFIEARATVPRHCYTFNSTILEYSDEQIDIRTCLGTNFDYEKLMRGEL
jgi:hypothetical protein